MTKFGVNANKNENLWGFFSPKGYVPLEFGMKYKDLDVGRI